MEPCNEKMTLLGERNLTRSFFSVDVFYSLQRLQMEKKALNIQNSLKQFDRFVTLYLHSNLCKSRYFEAEFEAFCTRLRTTVQLILVKAHFLTTSLISRSVCFHLER